MSISFALADTPLPNAAIVGKCYMYINRQEVMLHGPCVMDPGSSQDEVSAHTSCNLQGLMTCMLMQRSCP